ncbi:MAG: ABC transporter permease subunit [Gemmataceae bacterium]|nr:ABC transporter permease subunit [Gemmataceae bacterium]
MKYLAILKDSVREALDTKVIYVMIGLSLLVTVFVLMTSFKPMSAKEVMQDAVTGKIAFLGDMGGPGQKRRQAMQRGKIAKDEDQAGKFAIEKVEVLRGEPDEPESSYRVTVRLPLDNEKDAEAVRAGPGGHLQQLRFNLQLSADEFGAFKSSEVRLVGRQGNVVLFEFTTEPYEGARLAWPHEYSLFVGAVPLGGGLPLGPAIFISTVSLLWIGSLVTLLVSIIITAFFIPNMLRKGAVDVLLTKPIHRWSLLVYKYIGGLTFIFINTTVAIVGIWLALGLRSGIWANSFLLMIFVYTFFFAILYAVSALFGVLTRSSIVAILMTCGIWFFLFIVGTLYGFAELIRIEEQRENVPAEKRASDNTFWKVVRAMHFVLPRTSDINSLGNEALMNDFMPPRILRRVDEAGARMSISWGESISVSLVFIAVMLGLAGWRFETRDY